MTKYRIIEVTKGNEVYYKLQIRSIFGWWMTATQISTSNIGGSSEDLMFSTLESAKKYYNAVYGGCKTKIIEEG